MTDEALVKLAHEVACELVERRGGSAYSDWSVQRILSAIRAVRDEKEQRIAHSDLEILNNALNYFYPDRKTDGDEAADARQALFELRDRLQKETPLPVAAEKTPRTDARVEKWKDWEHEAAALKYWPTFARALELELVSERAARVKAEARVQELEADKVRLDWLDEHGWDRRPGVFPNWSSVSYDLNITKLRGAIDAAMAK